MAVSFEQRIEGGGENLVDISGKNFADKREQYAPETMFLASSRSIREASAVEGKSRDENKG